MKKKSTKQVIADLRELFNLDTQKKRDNHEIAGKFLIYKGSFKRKKAKKMLAKYFDKTEIKDGSLVMLKKTLAYSLIFNIVKDENKESKGKRQKEKEKEQGKRDKTIKC